METLIYPEIFRKEGKGILYRKSPGADPGQLARVAVLDKKNIYMPIQKHTDKVIILDSSLDPRIGDAVITNRKGILVGVQAADCVPILLYARVSGVAGAVHAGWRGTAAEILKKSIPRNDGSLLFIANRSSGCHRTEYTVVLLSCGYEVIEAMKGTAGGVSMW